MANVDMMWAMWTKKSAVAFFDWTRDSILIDLNSLPGPTHTGQTPSLVSRACSNAPVELHTGSGRTPVHQGTTGNPMG